MTAARRPISTGHHRRPAYLLLAMLCAAGAVSIAGFADEWRVNTTPSEPLGIWRVVRLDRAAQSGDIVFVCPPVTAVFMEALSRGYLRSGLCPGGFGPLIKRVIAVGGQRVDVSTSVTVDGRAIDCSQVLDRDGQGRALGHYEGGTVPGGTIVLHSCFPASWDSRYFGPVPQQGVLGLAEEVLTYAP